MQSGAGIRSQFLTLNIQDVQPSVFTTSCCDHGFAFISAVHLISFIADSRTQRIGGQPIFGMSAHKRRFLRCALMHRKWSSTCGWPQTLSRQCDAACASGTPR